MSAAAAAELDSDVDVAVGNAMSHQSSTTASTLATLTTRDNDDDVDEEDHDDYDDDDYVNDANTTRPPPPLIAQVHTVNVYCYAFCLSFCPVCAII